MQQQLLQEQRRQWQEQQQQLSQGRPTDCTAMSACRAPGSVCGVWWLACCCELCLGSGVHVSGRMPLPWQRCGHFLVNLTTVW
jgi:hypothetical protein